MAVTRYITEFRNLAETDEFVFPRNHYEMTLRRALRSENAVVIGEHYGIDLLGDSPALKSIVEASIRFLLVGTDSELNTLRDSIESKLYGFGAGYLVYSTGEKAKAKLINIPDVTLSYERPHIIPIVCDFYIYEDFV